jgi:hypothetical protein
MKPLSCSCDVGLRSHQVSGEESNREPGLLTPELSRLLAFIAANSLDVDEEWQFIQMMGLTDDEV